MIGQFDYTDTGDTVISMECLGMDNGAIERVGLGRIRKLIRERSIKWGISRTAYTILKEPRVAVFFLMVGFLSHPQMRGVIIHHNIINILYL